jgi:hypothetical protein
MVEAFCTFMTTWPGIWAAVLVVGFTALVVFSAVLKNYRPLNSAITRVEHALIRYKEKAKTEPLTEDDWNELSAEISQIENLKSAWAAYAGKVVVVTQPELSGRDEPSVMALKSSRDYFNEESVIELKSNLTKYRDSGNTLTGLGILFTFIGLACGICLANGGLTAGSEGISEELKSSLRQLLGGAGQAFTSSVLGILTAIIFTAFYRHAYKSLINRIGNFTENLDSLFPVLGEDRIKFAQLEYAAESKAGIVNLSRDLKRQTEELLAVQTQSLGRIEEGIRNMSKSQGDILGRFVKKATSDFSDQLGVKMREMNASFIEASKSINSSVKTLEGALSGMNSTMQAAADVSSAAARAVNNQVSETFEKIQESHRTILANAKKAEKEFVKVGSEIEGAGDRWSAVLDQSAKQFAQNIADSGKEAGDAFKDSVSDTGEGFARSVSSSAGVWQQQVGNSAEEIRQSLETFNKVREDFETALANLRTLRESDSDYSERLLDEYQALHDQILATSEALQTQMERFRSATEQLKDLAQKVRKHVDFGNLVDPFRAQSRVLRNPSSSLDSGSAKPLQPLQKAGTGSVPPITSRQARIRRPVDSLVNGISNLFNHRKDSENSQNGKDSGK